MSFFIYFGPFWPALFFPLLPSSDSNDPWNEYWNEALKPGSWYCLGVGLIKCFVSAEELAAGAHIAALSCASYPQDSVAGFKNKCLENTYQVPFISQSKSFPQWEVALN